MNSPCLNIPDTGLIHKLYLEVKRRLLLSRLLDSCYLKVLLTRENHEITNAVRLLQKQARSIQDTVRMFLLRRYILQKPQASRIT